MPDINSLLENSKKKFKKSSYRPWNYMDEIDKEESKDIEYINDGSTDNKIKVEEIKKHDYAPNKETKENISNNVNLEYSQQSDRSEDKINHFYSISRLTGHQKSIFFFILEKCLSNDSLSSGIVNGESLVSITNTSLRMVNTSIQRLVDKKLILRENGKRGRGGFYNFSLNKEVKYSAIEYRKLSASNNKEFLNSNDKTLDLPNNSNFPKDWEDLDIEPLQHIGFSKNHIFQLYKKGDIDTKTVQDSIYHFSYDLKYNKKKESITKTSPIAYFMAILKRSGAYTAPENYESPKTKTLRELLENKKKEKEKYDTMMKELISIAFEEWSEKLSEEEKDKIVPDEIRKLKLVGAKIASLKSYFSEKIWPEKKKDFLF